MAIRSGLGAQIGFAKESTYGTYVAPTKFVEMQSESLVKHVNRVDGGGFAAGRLARLGSRRVETNTSGAGSMTMSFPTLGAGILLENLMGTVTGPTQQAASTAYLQTHTLTDNFGKSLTIQKGIPDISTGTARPYNFVGCKVQSAEFSCGVDEDLKAVFEIDARAVQEVDSLATASYPSGVSSFTFQQGSVKLGTTIGNAASVDGVRNCTVRIERSMKTDRFAYGSGGLKNEPITNDYVEVSGSFEIDFLNKTDFIDRFTGNTQFALNWIFEGPIIASTYKWTMNIQLPCAFMDGSTPAVDGPDVVGLTVPFVARSDGTNPVATITYMNTETTL